MTQLHSAEAVGQAGRYTWIVSSCAMGGGGGETADAVRAAVAASGVLMEVEVHFTPDYSDMSVYGGPHADGKLKRTFTNR